MDCCPGCCFPDVIFFQYFSFNFGEITKATFKPKMDVLLGKNANSIGLLFLLKKKFTINVNISASCKCNLLTANISCIHEICKSTKK